MKRKDKKKILVVDDELYIRTLVKRIIEGEYTVLEASNGAEAEEIACQSKTDIILMDIMMPKVDGYQACARIKAHRKTKGIPIIMLTGLGHELNKKTGYVFGANGYITKPFDAQELRDAINKFLTS